MMTDAEIANTKRHTCPVHGCKKKTLAYVRGPYFGNKLVNYYTCTSCGFTSSCRYGTPWQELRKVS